MKLLKTYNQSILIKKWILKVTGFSDIVPLREVKLLAIHYTH